MNARDAGPVARTMSAEERARLVIALDHDLRQPQHSLEMGLRAMRLLVSDLRVRQSDEASVDYLLQKLTAELSFIQAAAKQVSTIQQDLFDAIRLEAEVTSPQSKTLAADELIDRVVKTAQGIARDLDIRSFSPRLNFVSDERWVERILINLVGNAVSHSHGKRILIGARRCGGGIAFEVRDNGRGMEPEEIARVFDPIRQVATSPMGAPVARSGLGLYTVRLFVQRLRGRIECRSRPKLGTCFRVVLPGPVSCSPVVSQFSVGRKSVAAGDRLMAVLDKDLVLLRAIERAFAQIGIEVYADHDPLRWLGVLTDLQRRPDLILLDFELGNRQGALYLDILRRKWAAQRVQILMLTANPGHPSAFELAKDAPVLKKPLSDESLGLIFDLVTGQKNVPTKGFL